ncbi:MAG: RNA 2',3'-cyclic phosphodiesterase [Planctomycetota bacterium]|nr:RNA 2',3'-cyclic phosphodiesterase [Planctomycetota bacterium]
MRLFYCLTLTDDVFEKSHKMLKTLRSSSEEFDKKRSLRWVKTANLHFTLKFLGEVPIVEIPQLIDSGQKAAAGMTPFTVKFSDFMRLGSRRRAVFCLGIKTSPPFQHLSNRLERDLVGQGFAPRQHKMLRPHMTLARLKKTNRALEKSMKKVATKELFPKSMKITGFELMKSQVHPTGATYSVVHRFEFSD